MVGSRFPDSFGEAPGLLDGMPVPAMSVAGMLAMKEQSLTLRNGRPWRDKDIGDIAVLRDFVPDRASRIGAGQLMLVRWPGAPRRLRV